MCALWSYNKLICLSNGSNNRLPKRPSIKYVTLFLTNFTPSPLSNFVTHLGTPLKYGTHLGPPHPRFLVVQKSGQTPLYKNLSQWLAGFLFWGFVWKVLSGVVCVRSP